MAPKSHHYNPRVYLRQFVSPSSKKDLWEYDLRQGTAKLSSPRDAGCEDYYHSFETPEGRDDASIEKSFSGVENRLPKLFEMVRNKRLIPLDTWTTLFTFAALQRARCPKALHSLQNGLSRLYAQTFELMKQAGHFDAAMKEQGFNPELIHNTEFEITAARAPTLLMMLDAWNRGKLVDVFARMKWGFLVAPPGMFFWTTDDPVCCWADRDPLSLFGSAVGPANSDAEITFPISRRVCAFGGWESPLMELYTVASAEQVHTINYRNICNGWRFAYGPTNDSKILDLVQKIAKSRMQNEDSQSD